ncbi:MAG: sulfotransferase family protein [Bacteroidota bacterium]
MQEQKVICIGWHKTGTTTLGDALLILGYRVLGARLDMAEYLLREDTQTPIALAGNFDALQDVPWNALYQELDQTYPGSKFILTVRDENKWLESAQKHFKETYTPMREWLYGEGVLLGNEALYLERFRQHYQEVTSYFAGREDDLLVLDLTAGDKWEKLCTFLGQPIPERAFPHSNKGKHQYNRIEKLVDQLKSLIPMPLRLLRMRLLRLLGQPDPRNRFSNRQAHDQMRERRK